ncbi:MAG: glycosyltransferase family 1 protein [Patescibacteria group bacterium]
MARILIDGRFVGVGDSQTRVVMQNLREILKLDRENKYTLLIRPQGIKEVGRYFGIGELDINKLIRNSELEIKNLCVSILDVPHYSKDEQIKLLSHLNKEKFDLVHFTQFNHPILYRGRYIVTIQDLTLIGHLHYFNFIKQLAFNMVMKSAIRDSTKIISISKVTTEDILDFVDIEPKKISLIYWGIDHNLFNLKAKDKSKIEQFKKKYGIKDEYFLYTGAWKKHKNLVRMLQAYEQYYQKSKVKKENPIQLVLVGKIDKNEPEVVAEIERINKDLSALHGLPSAIIATGFIEDFELPTAYAGALCYVIPSLNEGFGWPPLEAMACGTPVISSNVSCMPEIQGNASFYFDPYSIDEIAKAMEKVAANPRLQAELREKGLKQVQKYHWEDTAKKTLEVYKSLI